MSKIQYFVKKGPETARGWFLLPGTENKEQVREICNMMENSVKSAQIITIPLNDEAEASKIISEFFYSWDGKVEQMISGTGTDTLISLCTNKFLV